MTNPFSDIDTAFSPMFMDTLSADCKRNQTHYIATISCCVFPIDDIDPFDDQAQKSNIKKMNILIQKQDWNKSILSAIEPEIADKVVFDTYEMKVSKVENENGLWRLEGRTI